MKKLNSFLIALMVIIFNLNADAQCVSTDEDDLADLCVTATETANGAPTPAGTFDVWDAGTMAAGADGTDDISLTIEAVVFTPNANGTCDDGDFTITGCVGPTGPDFGATTSDDCYCTNGYVCITVDMINGFSSEASGLDFPFTSVNGSTEGHEAMFAYVTAGTDANGGALTLPTVNLAALSAYCEPEYNAGPVSAFVGATGPGTFAVDQNTGVTNDCATSGQNGEDTESGDNPNDNSDAQTENPNWGLNATDIITQYKIIYFFGNTPGTDCDADGTTGVGTNPSANFGSLTFCPPIETVVVECGACTEGTGGLVITELSYDPSGAQGNDGDCEYVEIFNSYSTPIVIDMNTTVTLSDGTTATLPAGTTIAPGEYVILTGSNFAGCMFTTPPPAGTQIIDVGLAGTLSNSGEDVTITLACAVDPAAGNTQTVTFSDASTPNAGGGGNSVYYPLDGTGPLEGVPTPGSGDCVACANTPYVCDAAECAITPDPATNIVCNDGGTPEDPSDDTYTFDVVVNGMNTNGTDTFNDDQGNTGIAYGTTVSYGPFPISGGDITVNYTDVDDPDCTNMIIATVPGTCSFPTAECGACIEGSAGLVITELSYDPSGTQGNDGDCEYIEIFNSYSTPIVIDMITTVMLSGGTTVTLPAGTTIAPGEYVILTGPNFAGCTWATPPPAGTQIIDAGVAGTLSNSGEDVTITLACALDPTAGNTQTVTFSDATTPNAGGGGQSVYYPLDGTGPIEGAPTPGSGDCVACANTPYECADVGVCSITPDPAINIVCDDNGTPGDPSDDTYTFDVLVNGSNTNGTNTFNDDQGNMSVAYGTTQSYGPFPISGGDITVTFTDVDDSTCTNTVIATAPPTCSTDACEITSATVNNLVCDDAGTPEDPSDDTYTFDVTVNGNNPGAGASNTFNDDQGNSGTAYGGTLSYGPFPISGGDITITYTDADDMTCTTTTTAPAPVPCSTPICDISNVVFTQNCTDIGDEYELCLSFDYANAGVTGQFNIYLDAAGTLTPTTVVAGPFNYTDYDAAIMGGATCFTVTGYTGDASDLETGLEVCVSDVDAPAPGTGLPPGSTPPPAGIPTFPCPQIYGILHNACAPAGGDEGPNEFVVIVNGADPTDVSSIIVDTPAGNDYNDFNTVTPPASWTCSCCVYLDETGSVPAGGVVVVTTAANMSTLDFTSLCNTAGTIYVLQDDGVGSTGHFSNSSPRATFLNLTGTPACDGSTSYSYFNSDGNDGDYTTFAGPDNPIATGSGTDAADLGTPDPGNIDSTGECTPQIAPASEVECFGCTTLDETACMQMVTCPVLVPVSDGASVCSGTLSPTTLSDWQAAVDAANPLDMTQDPDGLGTIFYSSTPNPNDGMWVPDGDVSGITGMHSGPGNCDPENQTVYVYLLCDDMNGDPSDDIYEEIGTFSVTVFPLIEDAVTLNSDGGCCPSVTVACPYFVENSYDANEAMPDCSAETGTGSITFSISLLTDPTDGACAFYEITSSYDCSVPTCQITPDMAANIVCDNAGTPDDPSDDTYTFDITVNGNSTFPGASNTFSDDQGNTGVAYGTTVSYGPFPISGGDIVVTFTDTEQADCTSMMMAVAPPTCSEEEPDVCFITPEIATNIVCDDAGTPNDPSDDTYTFDITVNGSNTFPGATNTFSDDQGNASIAYGTTVSYGPFPIAGGNVTVNFTDTEQADCLSMMMATAPATCSMDVVCEDEISGTVFAPPGCDVIGIEVTVYDDMGNVVATFTTDAMGVYDSTPTAYPCGNYTVGLTDNIPQCYIDASGETDPKPFVIDGDDDDTDTDGQNFMPNSIPTLSQWGLICLALLLMVYGSLMIGARTTAFEKYQQ